MRRPISRRPTTKSLIVLIGSAMLLAAGTNALAQYKWKGPNGETIYSDRPPPPEIKQAESVKMRGGASSGASELPTALRAVAARSPVTLYSHSSCQQACKAARQHLSQRGIPFAEKTIDTPEDSAAFKAAGFDPNQFPAISVGSTKIVGFEQVSLDQTLDQAGYPKDSALPKGFVRASATALSPDSGRAVREAKEREQQAAREKQRKEEIAEENARNARRANEPSIRF